jgi:nicotinate-nucleotide adenylyltransferase
MGHKRGTRITRVGVMGGTFDPIHIGHMIAASEALREFQLNRVIFVPTGRPWQKASFTDPEDRYQMTVLAAGSNPCFAVSRIEIDRVGPTYTIDTMQALRDFHGEDASLYFIIGADAVLRLGTWHRVEGLEKLAEIIALDRPGSDLDRLDPRPSWPVVHRLHMPQIGVSSSDIRRRVAEGRPFDYLVPAPVHRYILDQGLYADADVSLDEDHA